jgi:hypothetical protein
MERNKRQASAMDFADGGIFEPSGKRLVSREQLDGRTSIKFNCPPPLGLVYACAHENADQSAVLLSYSTEDKVQQMIDAVNKAKEQRDLGIQAAETELAKRLEEITALEEDMFRLSDQLGEDPENKGVIEDLQLTALTRASFRTRIPILRDLISTKKQATVIKDITYSATTTTESVYLHSGQVYAVPFLNFMPLVYNWTPSSVINLTNTTQVTVHSVSFDDIVDPVTASFSLLADTDNAEFVDACVVGGELFVICGTDRIVVFDTTNGAELRVFDDIPDLQLIGIASDGKYIHVVDMDENSRICVFSTDGKFVRQYVVDINTEEVEITIDGNEVYVSSALDHEIVVVSATTGDELRRFDALTEAQSKVAIFGELLYSYNWDARKVYVCNKNDGSNKKLLVENLEERPRNIYATDLYLYICCTNSVRVYIRHSGVFVASIFNDNDDGGDDHDNPIWMACSHGSALVLDASGKIYRSK